MTLQERIARMGLDQTTSTHDTTRTTTQKATGAPQGHIKDKISKFQEKAEDQPLLPGSGSFGLPGSRRVPSSADSRDQPRVASLGLGRATVPLHSVTMNRSASAGQSYVPKTSEPTGTGPAGSGAVSPASSSRASSLQRTPSSSGDSEVNPSATNVPRSALPSSTMAALAEGRMTPSARSVSSMDVEEGSYTSEAGPDPNSVDINIETDIAPSPLSSPVLTALIDPSNNTTMEETEPLSPTTLVAPTKGPLSALKAPLRSPSSLSVSSMVVEVGDDAPEVSSTARSGTQTPTLDDPAPIPSTIGEAGDPDLHAHAAQDDEANLARTNEELKKYEAEVTDVTAPHPHDERSTSADDQQPVYSSQELGRPVLSTLPVTSVSAMATGEGATPTGENQPEALGAGNLADDETPPASPAMPDVKCSDCGENVKFTSLVDHVCGAAAVGSTAVRDESDVECRGDSAPAQKQNDAAMLSPEKDAPDSPAATSATQVSQSQRSTGQIDSFVPQTESLVPDDVLDMYGDEDDDVEREVVPSGAGGSEPAVPVDVEDEHDTSATNSGLSSSDVPQDINEEEDIKASTKVATTSVYNSAGRSPYDDEDEHNYEGGTAVVTERISASHSMSRSNSAQK